MNADGRCKRGVTDVMCVVGTECAELARIYHASRLARTMLLQNPGRDKKSSRRRTVIVKAGGLPWQPTDHPYVIVRAVIEPLIPPLFRPQPHFVHPSEDANKETISASSSGVLKTASDGLFGAVDTFSSSCKSRLSIASCIESQELKCRGEASAGMPASRIQTTKQ